MNPEKPITAYNDPGNVKEQLRRQLGFIQTSCNSYDDGAHDEAVRIAVALRVLFHQNPPKSHSLINQLSLRASVKILSTFPEYEHQEGVVARIPVSGGREVCFAITKWQGVTKADVRLHFTKGESNELRPTKKGFRLNLALLPELERGLEALERQLNG